ncbi:MAG: hypothetical protein LC747_04915, partial [Acidobacteria bacterium]|nr:hypothetical protein [Acidobacteriota bacterium]
MIHDSGVSIFLESTREFNFSSRCFSLVTCHLSLVTAFMRILIVKLGSIGDIVHTLPSLAAIRRALP